MSDYVCSRCGASAGADARMGSLDVYLTCGCDRRGVWINDGRGITMLSLLVPKNGPHNTLLAVQTEAIETNEK